MKTLTNNRSNTDQKNILSEIPIVQLALSQSFIMPVLCRDLHSREVVKVEFQPGSISCPALTTRTPPWSLFHSTVGGFPHQKPGVIHKAA